MRKRAGEERLEKGRKTDPAGEPPPLLCFPGKAINALLPVTSLPRRDLLFVIERHTSYDICEC
jgi:hypothetical protein